MSDPSEKLLRVPVTPLKVGLQRLEREASHYLTHVHRAAVGDRFSAFDVESATEAVACVVGRDGPHATIRVDEIKAASSIPRQRLILIQAFGKGSKVDSIVRDATVLDVTDVWIVSTARSAVTDALEAPGRMQRWVKIAVEAARQCERGNIPNVRGVLTLHAALASLGEFCGSKWLLSPTAKHALGAELSNPSTPDVALMVGPEGGFDEQESALANAAGFRDVRLGARVLRSETAATAALGALAAHRRD